MSFVEREAPKTPFQKAIFRNLIILWIGVSSVSNLGLMPQGIEFMVLDLWERYKTRVLQRPSKNHDLSSKHSQTAIIDL